MYKCEIIADSLSPQGHRLITYKVTYPRIIHAEMCRHRILSRNSASSRAIPFKRMVEMVEHDPFIPIAWQKDHKGMQGTEYFTNSDQIAGYWLEARDEAIRYAKILNQGVNGGVTKQLCNRLLEPFLWHTEIITGTEWDNFFDLRCPEYVINWYPSYRPEATEPTQSVFKSKKEAIKNTEGECDDWNEEQWRNINESDAEIHIQAIAEMMWDAMNKNKPTQLKAGEWHIPFSDKIDYTSKEYADIPLDDNAIDWQDYAVKIATARCARISYETLGDNPKIDYEADIKLHDNLITSKHWSPLEHCARAMNDDEYYDFRKGVVLSGDEDTYNDDTLGWANNFRGFIQYRYSLENR